TLLCAPPFTRALSLRRRQCPCPGDQTSDGPPQLFQFARLGKIGLRAGALSLPTVDPGGVGRAKNDGSVRIQRANFSAEFKRVSGFATLAEQKKTHPS